MRPTYTQLECKHHGKTLFRLEKGGSGGSSYRCVECGKSRKHKKRTAAKLRNVEYLGGSCQSCGYSKNLAALEFHHVDKRTKLFSIHSCEYMDWEDVKEELDKCILLCANCHRETENPQLER